MYVISQFWAECERLVPGVQSTHYLPVYPPQVALFFSPLTSLPYFSAFLVWALASAVLYAACVATLGRMCPGASAYRYAFVASALAFPPFFNAISHGQLSIVLLACVTAAFWAYSRERCFLAGVALGLLAFKPQLFLAFFAVLAVARAWKAVAGMTVAGAAQLLLTVLLAGVSAVRSYAELAVNLRRVDAMVLSVKPYQMHSLRAFWLLLGTGRFEKVLWLASSVALIFLLWKWSRRQPPADLCFAACVIVAVLINPHLYVYDAVILAPALVVAADHALRETGRANAIGFLVYLLFACLLAGPLARFTHVQLSVVVMLALFFALAHEGAHKAEERSTTKSQSARGTLSPAP